MTDNKGSVAEVDNAADDGLAMLNEGGQMFRAKTAEFGRSATEAVENRRESVANGLGDAAAGIRGGADSMAFRGAQVSSMAHGVADSVESAAQYVRGHKTEEMWADLMGVVKAHPGKAVVAMLAVGYVAGHAIQTRRD